MRNNGQLEDFIEQITGSSHTRIEEDYGEGFVKLCSSEAERRQAAQDIRSSEDIAIEMLRNSRDAGAKRIFCALQREGSERTIILIDDGDGIPASMHSKIFEPRVTSKLDSAHSDRWGMHGRGMALYSVSSNSKDSIVKLSEPGRGAAIEVVTDLGILPERTDQSTFPYFERSEDTLNMRGPRNLLRTIAEFALDCRESVDVYCGSFTEVLATMYSIGMKTVPASLRVFQKGSPDSLKLFELPALASAPEELAEVGAKLGLDISARSARRIIDGEIEPLPTMMERIELESFQNNAQGDGAANGGESGSARSSERHMASGGMKVRFSKDDLDLMASSLEASAKEIADKYYLSSNGVTLRQTGNKLIAEFDFSNQI